MSARTMIATAALIGTLAVPAGAQQHQHGQAQGQEPGSMMACPMMQQMMQAMHGPMMGGMEGADMQGMRGQMMDSGMMGPGMMGAMHAGPGTILQSAEELALTDGQVERLEALQERTREEHQGHMQAMRGAHEAASAALEGDAPDLDAYATALNEAADLMVTAHVAMTRSALEARDVLTPEQRETLAGIMGDMHGMHGGMMSGGTMR